MARIARLYLDPKVLATYDSVELPPAAAHYLNRVLRLRPGDRWAALDGEGGSWLCQIETDKTSKKVGPWQAVPPLPLEATIGLALCKGSRFEDALEKLAELGAARIIPLQSERSERGQPSPAKFERWRQIGNSASALANRLVPLKIAPVHTLESFAEGLLPESSIFCQKGGSQAWELIASGQSQIQLAIGPEGGFSPAELLLLAKRARPMALGPLTLRVETASVCALSLALTMASRPLS